MSMQCATSDAWSNISHDYAALRKRNPRRTNHANVTKKIAETELPFINAEDDFILEIQTNTSALDFGTLKRERDDLKCINLRLEDELHDIVLQEAVQESAREINMLKHENQCLHSKLAAEQQMF